MTGRAIEPGPVLRTSQQIYTWFFDEIGLHGCEYNGEIAVEQVIADAATVVIAVIRRLEFPVPLVEGRFPGNTLGFKVHSVIISGTERLQAVA